DGPMRASKEPLGTSRSRFSRTRIGSLPRQKVLWMPRSVTIDLGASAAVRYGPSFCASAAAACSLIENAPLVAGSWRAPRRSGCASWPGPGGGARRRQRRRSLKTLLSLPARGARLDAAGAQAGLDLVAARAAGNV